MTAPPLPTFVPQDAWYTVTTGNVNPSVADTVPNITYLQPILQNGELTDGLVGSLDGSIIGLAGEATTYDGGQKWLMWDEDSLVADNGSTVFCPFVEPGNPGRWLALSASSSTGPGLTVSTQTYEAGAERNILSSAAPFVYVFIRGRETNAETLVNLPTGTFLGQTFQVKDAEGDAATYNIIVRAFDIDGATEFTFYANYQGQNFTFNGVAWNAT